VRLQWSRADELAWAPFGTPMAVRLDAELDSAGAIMHWNTELWSGTSAKRPGFLPHLVDLLATFHLDPPIPMSSARDNPIAFVGAVRNAEPPYEVPFQRITQHKLPELPLRTSSLRTLGGFCNVFAIECFMDELAQQAGIDPLEFRLRHLHDPRGRKVLETVAEMAGWDQHPSALGKALGLGYSRYKNTAAYVAVIAEVEAGDDLRVSHLYAAVDAGLVINPDGLLNQMEGGLVQAMSWTTREQVRFDSRGITSNSWEKYPISRFGDVPPLTVQIVAQNALPPLGVGEAAQGPAGAAIANAAAAALGFRVHDLPITRDGIVKAMSRVAAKETAADH
jgi:CO/xanthine dehydrogenase Mo-binding subunit